MTCDGKKDLEVCFLISSFLFLSFFFLFTSTAGLLVQRVQWRQRHCRPGHHRVPCCRCADGWRAGLLPRLLLLQAGRHVCVCVCVCVCVYVCFISPAVPIVGLLLFFHADHQNPAQDGRPLGKVRFDCRGVYQHAGLEQAETQ